MGHPNDRGFTVTGYTITYSSRAIAAFCLHMEGMSYSKIGKHMGISRQRSYELTMSAARRISKKPSAMRLVPENLHQMANKFITFHKEKFIEGIGTVEADDEGGHP